MPPSEKGTFEIQCPFCRAEAIYKYGKTRTGKQRYLCVMCGRQFILGVKRFGMEDRPGCPVCGRSMHVYKREYNIIRFRCSHYPECRTFTKISIKKEIIHGLLHA
jgi:transposase-like protein